MECMDNMAFPTSTVRIPIFDSIGPTVDPHGLRMLFDTFILMTDKEPCSHVISHFKFLHLTTFLCNKLLYDERTYRISGIALFRVRLDDNSSIHQGSVVNFVL